MDHKVYSYDAEIGTKRWVSQDLGGALVGTPAVGTDGTLYVGTFGKEMLALNTSDGSIKWRFTTEDWVWSGPALVNNSLFFGDLSGYLYGLNAADGTALWRIQRPTAIVDTPAVAGDNLYFTTETDALSIVSTAGDIISSPVIGGVIYSAPFIVGDTILIAPTGFDSLLVALDLNGTQKWPFTPAK
jgi:outer membrane protein assembly factor BamB